MGRRAHRRRPQSRVGSDACGAGGPPCPRPLHCRSSGELVPRTLSYAQNAAIENTSGTACLPDGAHGVRLRRPRRMRVCGGGMCRARVASHRRRAFGARRAQTLLRAALPHQYSEWKETAGAGAAGLDVHKLSYDAICIPGEACPAIIPHFPPGSGIYLLSGEPRTPLDPLHIGSAPVSKLQTLSHPLYVQYVRALRPRAQIARHTAAHQASRQFIILECEPGAPSRV